MATPPPRRIGVGSMELFSTGASRYDLRDPYHIIATATWPMFFVWLVFSELLINLCFALLYTAVPGCIANVHAGSIADAFFFSIETLATVGYGAMVPQSRYGHVVSAIEIFCGMIYTAVVTGVIFIRFSKPKAKIIYAERPVVAQHNGGPTLMIRIANGRTHMLADVLVRLTVLKWEVSPEGQRFRRIHPLELVRPEFPLFAITWTVMHRIDEKSPLYGCRADKLQADGVRLFMSIQARDPALGALVHDLKVYAPELIAFGMRYSDAVSLDDEGRTTADLRRVSLIEADGNSAAGEAGR
ncbi:MAG: ion channel [Pseudomonadota bacterium]|nr:ion channel [Pseudomonadota bacterium]